jgi:RHS repeat-associated protein
VPGQGPSAGVLAFTDQHTDVVGSFTAAGTALAGSSSYDPLGNVTSTAGSPAGKLGYQSGWTDAATGQVNMAARWYDPAAGQFTSRDATVVSPVPNPAAANPFAYVDDNPLTRTDPAGTSWWGDITHAWHAAASWASSAWDTAASWASSAWDATTSWVSSTWDATISSIDAQIRALDREISVLNQEIKDAQREVRSLTARAVHTVARAAVHVTHRAAHAVTTAYHEVRHVAKAAATFARNHEAAIAGIAAGVAVFAGCEALTAGVVTVGCAAAAGAVGGLVSYGISCGSSAGGCSAAGALVSAGEGALGGALGGALAGPLGGKLASSILGRVLPDLAIQGLTGATAGATAGGAAAAAYSLDCRSSSTGCSWTGLAAATSQAAAAGALTGGALAAASGLLSSPAATRGAPDDSVKWPGRLLTPKTTAYAHTPPKAVINEGVNSVSNIGAGAAARSADTIAAAEPGSAFSGVYDPASRRLSSYPSVADPAAPGAPVNAVRMYGGHGQINSAVFGGSDSTVGFTAFLNDEGDAISMGWRSRSVNVGNFGQIEAPMEYRQPIMDIIGEMTGLPVSG